MPHDADKKCVDIGTLIKALRLISWLYTLYKFLSITYGCPVPEARETDPARLPLRAAETFRFGSDCPRPRNAQCINMSLFPEFLFITTTLTPRDLNVIFL